MTAGQNTLPVDGENRGYVEALHQMSRGFRSILRAATEHDQGTACFPKQISANSYRLRVGVRSERKSRRPTGYPLICRRHDDIQWNLDVNGPGPCTPKNRECARKDDRDFVRPVQGVAEGGKASHQIALRREFMKPPFPKAKFMRIVDAGNDKDRNRICVGLAEGSRDVGQSGSGDDKARSRIATGAGVAVGHEPRTLLVPRCDVAQSRAREAAIELDGMNPGDPEHRVDTMGPQEFD